MTEFANTNFGRFWMLACIQIVSLFAGVELARAHYLAAGLYACVAVLFFAILGDFLYRRRGSVEEVMRAEIDRLRRIIDSRPTVDSAPPESAQLHDGEHYAGIVHGKAGEPNYHLILLPGEAEPVTWAEAKEWAGTAGGELPTRREQLLLYANLKELFRPNKELFRPNLNEPFWPNWYWSCEQHAAISEVAWFWDFNDGIQGYGPKIHEFRARAVRRVPI